MYDMTTCMSHHDPLHTSHEKTCKVLRPSPASNLEDTMLIPPADGIQNDVYARAASFGRKRFASGLGGEEPQQLWPAPLVQGVLDFTSSAFGMLSVSSCGDSESRQHALQQMSEVQHPG